MLNRVKKRSCCRTPVNTRSFLCLLAAAAILFLFFQTACGKKSKAPVASISPTRLIILPFNVPTGDKNLRWTALAAPILMAKEGESSRDLVLVPLWEVMPTAIESAGASRSLTADSVATIANWLSAKWSILGDVSPAKRGVSMTIDFIPAKSTQVPFRYMKTGSVDVLGAGFHEAFKQFLRYLAARPLEQAGKSDQSMSSARPLAEAVDREYGWFVDADPGKAQAVVSDLAQKDERLAKFLFNPSLYPVLAKTK